MCVKAQDASRRENIGDGTPEYCAPETSTSRGTSAASEIHAVGVFLVERLMNNCPFGSEELLEAAADRRIDLEGKREDLEDKIEIDREKREEEELQGGEEGEDDEEDGDDDDDDDDDGGSGERSAEEQLELVRVKEHTGRRERGRLGAERRGPGVVGREGTAAGLLRGAA